MKYTDTDYSLGGKAPSSLHKDMRGDTDGYVATPNGYVRVVAEVANLWRKPYTMLLFAHKTRLYNRTYEGQYLTKRGMVMVARRFAREKGGK